MLSANFKPKRIAAASRGFLAIARLSCFSCANSGAPVQEKPLEQAILMTVIMTVTLGLGLGLKVAIFGKAQGLDARNLSLVVWWH